MFENYETLQKMSEQTQQDLKGEDLYLKIILTVFGKEFFTMLHNLKVTVTGIYWKIITMTRFS